MAVLIVDADSIVYMGAVVAEVAEVPMFKKDNVMKKIIRQKLDDIQSRWSFWDMKIAIRGENNFRKHLYPAYKSNRPKLSDLMYALLEEGNDYLKKYWDVTEAHGMEADDLVCIWAYECMEKDEDYIIAGIDKDLKQIPGKHFNYKNGDKVIIDDDTANLNLMLQCITGDSGDNIPGIKGIGPAKANKILAGVPMARRWASVCSAWSNASAGDPELSRTLLTMIKSWEDYKEIKKLVQEKSIKAFGKECEQKKTEDLTPGRSASEFTASPSVSTKPTSESEEAMS